MMNLRKFYGEIMKKYEINIPLINCDGGFFVTYCGYEYRVKHILRVESISVQFYEDELITHLPFRLKYRPFIKEIHPQLSVNIENVSIVTFSILHEIGHVKTIQQWTLLGDPSLKIGGYT